VRPIAIAVLSCGLNANALAACELSRRREPTALVLDPETKRSEGIAELAKAVASTFENAPSTYRIEPACNSTSSSIVLYGKQRNTGPFRHGWNKDR
jgi:hypothetical protein